MPFALSWLSSVLLEANLKVAEVPGWPSRGHGDIGKIMGVMVHHTAGPAGGNMPSLATLRDGRPDLAGPLANLGLGRDGTFYVLAAGVAYHAGAGQWHTLDNDGNQHLIGIECENAGTQLDLPWPDAQMTALRHGIAALLRYCGVGADCGVGHREYAPTRKIEPRCDMDPLRNDIAAILAGRSAPVALIPAAETAAASPAAAGDPRPTLRRPTGGALVVKLQQALGVAADGFFGPSTEAAVRQFQREHALTPDGIVGPKTWAALPAGAA